MHLNAAPVIIFNYSNSQNAKYSLCISRIKKKQISSKFQISAIANVLKEQDCKF